MMQQRERLAYLLDVYSTKKATQQELEEFFDLIEDEDNTGFKSHLEQLITSYQVGEPLIPADQLDAVNWDGLYQKIILEKESKTHITDNLANASRPLAARFSWFRWNGAAAIVLLLIGVSVYFIMGKGGQPSQLANTSVQQASITAPTSIHAVLTLAGGQHIFLDKTPRGLLATQGAVQIEKVGDGEVAYRGHNVGSELNTLQNPSGSKVLKLILDDGTKIWLNAASSLTFPSSFSKDKRTVELNGEGYFEVAHQADRPFFVQKGKMSVQVLGTHFNVSAYNDAKSIKVTLLEGLVNIKDGSAQQILKPGQQARMDNSADGSITVKKDVDIDEVMDWYHGKFTFKNRDIHTIMQQVARWYNVEVKYEDEIKEKFYTDLSRTTNIDTLLKMLEATKAVHFKIENRKITVMKGTD